MKLELIIDGSRFRFYVAKEKSQLSVFDRLLKKHGGDDENSPAARLTALLTEVADQGIQHISPKRLRPNVRNGCFEFKDNESTLRLYAHRHPDDGSALILHSFDKKRGRRKAQDEAIGRLDKDYQAFKRNPIPLPEK